MPRRVQFHGVLGPTVLFGKAVVVAASLASAGCSVMAPFERAPAASLAADASLTTGSIPPRATGSAASSGQVTMLSPQLDQEDWRRARAALATALDPQGNGSVVRWDNAESGAKGSFAPVGAPFLVEDEICRTFVAGLSLKEPEKWLQGSACRIAANDWQIKELKPWQRPG